MPKSQKAPPPYAPNNPDFPVQEHQPLLQHQYTVQATSPTLVHSPRSPSFSDPNLQYFEPLLLAPSCKFTNKDSNTFRITVYSAFENWCPNTGFCFFELLKVLPQINVCMAIFYQANSFIGLRILHQ